MARICAMDTREQTVLTVIDTPRLRLRCWLDADREPLAAMHADPDVMVDYGKPISRAASDAKIERYMAAFARHGFCRWAIESRDGTFLGYTGVMPGWDNHPLGPHSRSAGAWCAKHGASATPRKLREPRSMTRLRGSGCRRL
jgi:RimJ/RimL family protein N-acetyltransferase